MKIEIVYIHAPHCGPDYAWWYPFRFLHSYHHCPTTVDHRSTVVCNSGKPDAEAEALFLTLKNCSFLFHDNSGFDIGGFQHAASVSDSDLIVFFGTSAYICRPGWLERVVQAYEKHGETVYGSMVNAGDHAFAVWPHIRTTGFWISPKLMNAYPEKVVRPEQRHPFEHKENCLTQWVKKSGKVPLLVTWQGEYPPEEWRRNHHGFQQGDQSQLVFGDRYCERPFYPVR